MAAPEGIDKACSAREVLEEFKKSGVRVAWPRLADLLKVPQQMVHRILKKHEPVMMVNEDKSLTEVLNHWENNDPDHTWEVLCLALLSDRVYKELGASLYSKHVKPEEFTVDLVYEEIKDLTTDPQEIAYVLIEDSKQLREIWGDSADKLSFEERTKLAINHWMMNNPASSWLLLAKRLEWYIHGENEIAAQEIATKIRDKYLPKVDERRAYGPPQDDPEDKLLEKFSADEAFKELTAVEDWFGLGWFLKIEEDELKEIERSHGRDDDRKLAMLRLWVETQPKTASWNDLAFAVKKMPQHQSLAQDIEDKLFKHSQSEMIGKNLKELYTQFFAKLIGLLCDDQTHSSLVDQLTSLSLISETDKETQLSSVQDPRQRAASLLSLLNTEEKPQHIIELVRAMKDIDEMKSLADEMSAQYEAMEGPSEQYEAMEEGDNTKEVKKELIGVHIVDEITFELEKGKAKPLLWEEHGFRMFFPENALLPHETYLVTVKAIIAGPFQFPEGTELVSAMYAISLTKPLHEPVKMEMQHCVKLGRAENSKFMSFAVASQDSVPYKFQLVPGGVFKRNSSFGSLDRQSFCFMAIVKFLQWLRPKKAQNPAPPTDPVMYTALTFKMNLQLEYQWILVVSRNIKTMKQYLRQCFNKATEELFQDFSFEEEKLTVEIEGPAQPGWIIEPLVQPCIITKASVDSYDTAKYDPVFCKVRIVIEQPARPPSRGLRNSIRLDGITPIRRFLIHCYPPRRQSYSELPPMSPLLGKTLESAPTQQDLLKIVIKNIPDKWFEFGAYLGIDVNVLDAVKTENEKTKRCFLKVFKIWKEQGIPPFTWKNVIDVLKSMELQSLSQHIEEHLDLLEQ